MDGGGGDCALVWQTQFTRQKNGQAGRRDGLGQPDGVGSGGAAGAHRVAHARAGGGRHCANWPRGHSQCPGAEHRPKLAARRDQLGHLQCGVFGHGQLQPTQRTSGHLEPRARCQPEPDFWQGQRARPSHFHQPRRGLLWQERGVGCGGRDGHHDEPKRCPIHGGQIGVCAQWRRWCSGQRRHHSRCPWWLCGAAGAAGAQRRLDRGPTRHGGHGRCRSHQTQL